MANHGAARKVAIITGQDWSYHVEFLLHKGYRTRRTAWRGVTDREVLHSCGNVRWFVNSCTHLNLANALINSWPDFCHTILNA